MVSSASATQETDQRCHRGHAAQHRQVLLEHELLAAQRDLESLLESARQQVRFGHDLRADLTHRVLRALAVHDRL